MAATLLRVVSTAVFLASHVACQAKYRADGNSSALAGPESPEGVVPDAGKVAFPSGQALPNEPDTPATLGENPLPAVGGLSPAGTLGDQSRGTTFPAVCASGRRNLHSRRWRRTSYVLAFWAARLFVRTR